MSFLKARNQSWSFLIAFQSLLTVAIVSGVGRMQKDGECRKMVISLKGAKKERDSSVLGGNFGQMLLVSDPPGPSIQQQTCAPQRFPPTHTQRFPRHHVEPGRGSGSNSVSVFFNLPRPSESVQVTRNRHLCNFQVTL